MNKKDGCIAFHKDKIIDLLKNNELMKANIGLFRPYCCFGLQAGSGPRPLFSRVEIALNS